MINQTNEQSCPSSDDKFARANEKSKKRKAARDKMLAKKTTGKGLIMVHTGKGKGKSTAAFGVAFRAIGNALRVGVVQYVKGAWETGERRVLEKFPECCEIHTLGEGFTWETQDRARDIAAAQKAWRQTKKMIDACRGKEPAFDLLVLDELNISLRYEHLPLDEVIESLKNKPQDLHIIITGRNAKEELIEIADLVTEMTLIKHPFREQNIKAQRGIEY